MSTVANKPWISEEEYLRLEAPEGMRYEYYRGEIFAMVGGSPTHSRLKSNANRLIGNALVGSPCVVFDGDLGVKVEATGLYTYPDLSVCCGPRQWQEKRTLLNPTLLMEVLSPSTEAYDRGTKFAHYEQIPSLQHYLLVAQNTVRVEHYLRQGSNKWLLTAYTDSTAMIRLESIGIELSLSELYQDVEWETATSLRAATSTGEQEGPAHI